MFSSRFIYATALLMTRMQRCQFVRFSRESYGFPLIVLTGLRAYEAILTDLLKKEKNEFFFFNCYFLN